MNRDQAVLSRQQLAALQGQAQRQTQLLEAMVSRAAAPASPLTGLTLHKITLHDDPQTFLEMLGRRHAAGRGRSGPCGCFPCYQGTRKLRRSACPPPPEDSTGRSSGRSSTDWGFRRRNIAAGSGGTSWGPPIGHLFSHNSYKTRRPGGCNPRAPPARVGYWTRSFWSSSWRGSQRPHQTGCSATARRT